MDASLLPTSTVFIASFSCSKCPCSGLSFSDSPSWGGLGLRIASRNGMLSSKSVRLKNKAMPTANTVGTLPELEDRDTRGYNRWERPEGRSFDRAPGRYDVREDRFGVESGERRGRSYNATDRGTRWAKDAKDEGRDKGRKFITKDGPKVPPGAKAPKHLILKPPMEDKKLAERLLASPQLSLKSFPVLSACLPSAPFRKPDLQWISENILELKDALGCPQEDMEEVDEDSSVAHLDTLLYLAFQHEGSTAYRRAFYVRNGHTRLAFLGQYVLELALVELLLQMFPKDTTGVTRDRIYLLTGKKFLPQWVKSASMERLIFPEDDIDRLKRNMREPAVKSVFQALIAAVYLTTGMQEVYRLLFEVFGLDPHAQECQPKPRSRLEDIDFLSPDLEKELTWQDIAFYEPPPDSLFAEPRLFRACVPPGVHRFRGNLWEEESLPAVKKVLGYPLSPAPTDSKAAVQARNLELELGLQLCFLHPSKYKFEHPRFCNERLELLGSRVMDVILAERLLMKHLEGPGEWLGYKHRKLLMNRICGRLLRDKKLGRHIMYSDERIAVFERVRKMRNLTTSGSHQAIHGLGYLVHGRPEVRRLMFDVFDTEAGPTDPAVLRLVRPALWINPNSQQPQNQSQGPQFQFPPNYSTQLRSSFPSSTPSRPPPRPFKQAPQEGD
eukprot:TRINITY_DN13005_c0_g1_i1.p1 TRINITY_DN13005_c0_g1~~TRINITY_DN13005_c0_g1_i1.p1  ORF type:complete len:676 (-),score=114.36 TRINITY_DN13005_c0_g1_i1:56-2062(-)